MEKIKEQILQDIHNDPKSIIVITGPTCTGKSDLAIELAKELEAEIINCDSRLIFDEMNIGTAKPSQEELDSVHHHLVNIKKPNESYSAAEYKKDFDACIEEICKRRNINFILPDPKDSNDNRITIESSKPIAIVVGGTGLYIRAALENLDMPEVGSDEKIRAELKSRELEDLVVELKSIDPEGALDVDLPNKQRVVRALEMIKISGKKLNEIRKRFERDRYDAKFYGLNFNSRRKLYDLINYRVVLMLKRGLIHEVEALLNKYGPTGTILHTIGYAEIYQFLNDENMSVSKAMRLIQKKTRVYAKRQMTWFKSNQRVKWFYKED